MDGNESQDWIWPCVDEDPDLQITPPNDLLQDGSDCILHWLESLLDGHVEIYKPAPPPVVQVLELPVFEQVDEGEEYELEVKLVNDFMFYQVAKPHTDRPYTTVVRNFKEKGHTRFFTNLFVCPSWGVCEKDILFLKKAWEWFRMDGEFDLDVLMKDATEACRPDMGCEPEPEVWRTKLESVLEIFNKRDGFYSFLSSSMLGIGIRFRNGKILLI